MNHTLEQASSVADTRGRHDADAPLAKPQSAHAASPVAFIDAPAAPATAPQTAVPAATYAHARKTTEPPLCVDLDGTLIHSDLLHEGLAAILRTRPWEVVRMIGWLTQGKAFFKVKVAQHSGLDLEALPWNHTLISWLKEQRAAGRYMVLATAATEPQAQAIAKQLDLFDEVISSTDAVNLAGTAKRDALISRFGEQGFDYVGDSSADLNVWPAARQAIAVDPKDKVRQALADHKALTVMSCRPPITLKVITKAIRVRQWMKNLLVFVPLIAGHQLNNLTAIGQALLAFAAMSLCASSIYLLNDLSDLASDRRHRTKCKRPFASGALPVLWGPPLTAVLLVCGFSITVATLPPLVTGLMALYIGTTLMYSGWMKRKPLVDVFALSGLYTMRVLIGAAATGVLSSPWLLAFSIFTFLSLAFAKRASELVGLDRTGRIAASGRSYFVWDEKALGMLGVASAFSAAIVMSLYIQSEGVRTLYQQPTWLWMLVPLTLYWLARVWLLTERGAMDEDPIVFATTDRTTYLVVALGALSGWLAMVAPFPVPGTLG